MCLQKGHDPASVGRSVRSEIWQKHLAGESHINLLAHTLDTSKNGQELRSGCVQALKLYLMTLNRIFQDSLGPRGISRPCHIGTGNSLPGFARLTSAFVLLCTSAGCCFAH